MRLLVVAVAFVLLIGALGCATERVSTLSDAEETYTAEYDATRNAEVRRDIEINRAESTQQALDNERYEKLNQQRRKDEMREMVEDAACEAVRPEHECQ